MIYPYMVWVLHYSRVSAIMFSNTGSHSPMFPNTDSHSPMFPNTDSHSPILFLRYIVTGFIDKNKDPIYQDFKRLLYNRSEVT